MNKEFPLPSLERVRELFDYYPEYGLLIRRTAVPKAPRGSIAGTINSDGALICRVDYKIYYVHRLIWLHYYGEPPSILIDHIDLNPSNNRISNLRLASDSQNAANKKGRTNSRSLIKGAHWSTSEGRWRSSIKVNRKQIHLGWFDTKEEAAAAYAVAAAHYFGEFARVA
jgi:hypothetical protein